MSEFRTKIKAYDKEGNLYDCEMVINNCKLFHNEIERCEEVTFNKETSIQFIIDNAKELLESQDK
jgi:hypothetical protein